MNFDLNILKERLSKRGYKVFICTNKEETRNIILQRIMDNNMNTVGIGNSLTIRELGLKDCFLSKIIYEHIPPDSKESDLKALSSDIYFTSANAITYCGQIVNIDGTGNRISATCFGPKNVVYIISKNKITETLEEAIDRVKNLVAVKLAKKYNRKTPCVLTGKCEDCLSPECICNVMAIHRRQLYGNKITIILIDENMGI